MYQLTNVAVLGLTVASLACQRTEGFKEQPGEVVIRTSRGEYVAEYQRGEGAGAQFGFAVVARLENRSDSPVYLSRCSPTSNSPVYGVSTTAQTQYGHLSAYSPVWFCFPHDRPIIIDAGASRTDTVYLRGPNTIESRTERIVGAREGEFLLTYTGGTCPEVVTCPLPTPIRSNAFRVETERLSSQAPGQSDERR